MGFQDVFYHSSEFKNLIIITFLKTAKRNTLFLANKQLEKKVENA